MRDRAPGTGTGATAPVPTGLSGGSAAGTSPAPGGPPRCGCRSCPRPATVRAQRRGREPARVRGPWRPSFLPLKGAPKLFGVQRRILNEPSAILNNQRMLTTRLLLVHRTVVERGTLRAAAAALGYTV